jgi:hypothetical protein
MGKNQTSQGAHAGVLSSTNRQLFAARLVLAALLLALSLTSLQPTASAQSCVQQCERSYVECLHAATGDPGPMLTCDDAYDSCWQAC